VIDTYTTMPFSVTCFTADANDDIISVDWQYSNTDGTLSNTYLLADGTLSNTHVFATPAGDFSVAEVTQATLVGWLEDQLPNTAEEFDAAITNAKARAEYEAGFKKYNREADNTYAIPVEEELEEVEASAS